MLERLAREYADTGRAAQFEVLQGAIGRQARQVPYAELAARLGTTEGAVQQAVHRLRKRYRAILREQIAATLDDPDEAAIDDEIRDLFAALGELIAEKIRDGPASGFRADPVTRGQDDTTEPTGGPDHAREPVPELRCPAPRQRPGGLCPRCLLLAGPRRRAARPGPRLEIGTTVDLPRQAGLGARDARRRRSAPSPASCSATRRPARSPAPIVRPGGDDADPSIRYRIDGEIARGGMGAVLKGRDPDLGRDLAVKVLLRATTATTPELVRRFVEEAQIGGQLQHPGIVPVYELGTFADRRPFFTMKLVKGRTLADAARRAGRTRPTTCRGSWRSSSRSARRWPTPTPAGVIHRDLKPSNVMVGGFGEVQVMDWGLAKVLPRGGVADDATAGQAEPPGDADRHGAERLGRGRCRRPARCWARPPTWPPSRPGARSTGSTSGPTSSPWARSSARSSPASRPSPGRDRERDPPQGGAGRPGRRPGPARRLRGRRRADRPGEGLPGGRAARTGRATPGVVAERMTAYLAGVQERLQAAERERAVAEARAVEERRRRKVQLALAASVLALTTLGGLSTTYYLQQRAERAGRSSGPRRGSRSSSQADTLRDQASAQPRGHRALAGRAGRRRAGRSRRRCEHQRPAAGPAARDPGRAGRGPARQGAARSPGRHPRGRGRRPGRLDHRRRLRRRLPRGRDRSGEPAAGRGGGEDQGPPAVGGAGPGRGAGRLGGRPPSEAAGRGRRRRD